MEMINYEMTKPQSHYEIFCWIGKVIQRTKSFNI